jgi:hypothetical protein
LIVDLIGQRNALLFYSQRLQAALQTQKYVMLYISQCHDHREAQLAAALQADQSDTEYPAYMSYNHWQKTHMPVEAFSKAAPYVAECLADCFVPLDPDYDYGLPVKHTICNKIDLQGTLRDVQRSPDASSSSESDS